MFARLLGVAPERVAVDQVGLNHLTWVRAVRARRRATSSTSCSRATATRSPRTSSCRAALLDELGAVPSYYLRYFYAHDAVLAEQRAGTPRAATVAEIERELLELYRDPALDTKPALLEQRGGAFYSEAATALLAALVQGDGSVHVVDVRNGGALPGLAADDVVEVPARVGPAGPVAAAAGARSRPRCSASCSTSRPTSGSRPARRSAGTPPTSAARCSPTRSSARSDRVDALSETLLAPAGSAA